MEMHRFRISDMWVTLSTLDLCLWQLCYDFDSGPFTKVASFDLAKAVEGGTAGWYGRAQWLLDLMILGFVASLT
jgi:hypothetical protein